MPEEIKRTELNQLGEFGLIDRISNTIELKNKASVLGIGDDGAVLDPDGKHVVISSDMLIEGIHFDLSFTPLKHLGYKAVAVNISDIAAMNAIPGQITVNIALSNRFSLEAIDTLYEGIRAACDQYKIDLVGGDTTSSTSGLIISVTAVGYSNKEEVVTRSGAGEKDIICVSGDLGAAYLGLLVLQREKEVYLSNPEMQPKLDEFDYPVKRQLKPEARMDIIYELKDLGVIPTSMIDISDGLASELLHLSKSSGVGLNIHSDKIPITEDTFNAAESFNMDPITCALNGGEDYELLFTIKQEDYERIRNLSDITLIGYMTGKTDSAYLITNSGQPVPLNAQGFTHF